MNIKEGDTLVVSNRRYPIKSCADWSSQTMNTRGFKRMANITASTKRMLKVETTVESSLRCTPLDPVDPELKKRLALDTPHELLQTFVSDGTGFVRLILEDLKQ